MSKASGSAHPSASAVPSENKAHKATSVLKAQRGLTAYEASKVRKVSRATAVRKGPSASRVLWAHKDRSEVKANKGHRVRKVCKAS